MTAEKRPPRTKPVVSRRRFLAAAMTSALVGGSGCLGGIKGGTPASRLGWVALKNYQPDPQQIEVEIIRDDSVVHRSRHSIPGKPDSRIPGTVVECTWGDTSGQYRLRGRVSDGEWVERSIPRTIENSAEMDANTDCVIAEGAFGRYGAAKFDWLVQAWCDEVPEYEGGCDFAAAND